MLPLGFSQEILWCFGQINLIQVTNSTLIICFFREDDLPEENDSTNCEALCQSTSSGHVDSCGGLSTHSDHFFVLVTAHAQYSNAVLSFTGDNLQHIENVQSDD